ncbi:IS30 family transposase [Frisingicoccus sp.]|uniref:IS30 family transposase n=1 Tax=Frisingicoccus sp. TaxID=1918627 RepID=UPI00386CA29B
MANNKHLTIDNRCTIQTMLNDKASFKAIADVLDKDPSTISKEIRSHLVFRKIGGMHLPYNSCALRFKCTKNLLCSPCHAARNYKLCKRCNMCNVFCKDFQKEICSKLLKPPYVCNGCGSRNICSLEKRFYYASEAQNEYRLVLSESRSGISLSEAEVQHLEEIVSPLIRQKQSPHHICVTNRDSIMVSERTIYRLIDARILSAMNMDLPRKVRFSARKNTVHLKVDKACRIGRTFECFTAYLTEHPDLPVVQLDSVEGKKGGKVLLTIHFVKAEFMLAFLRDRNDSQSVIDIFERLYLELQPDRFMSLFRVCLADNGSEFSNPMAIEYDRQDNLRTRIFYCDPSAPYQKGSAERNHEFIRMFIPKGTDLEHYTQDDIDLMMNHINSYVRESLGNKSPYEMFAFLYGQKTLDLLECHLIPPQEVTLSPSVFRKEVQA